MPMRGEGRLFIRVPAHKGCVGKGLGPLPSLVFRESFLSLYCHSYCSSFSHKECIGCGLLSGLFRYPFIFNPSQVTILLFPPVRKALAKGSCNPSFLRKP